MSCKLLENLLMAGADFGPLEQEPAGCAGQPPPNGLATFFATEQRRKTEGSTDPNKRSMPESDSSPKDDFIEAALRKTLKRAALAYRDAMPLDRPTALAEFETALAAFAAFMRSREDSGADTLFPRDQP